MENHEQRCVIIFFFLEEKRSKEIHGELSGVLEEAAVSFTKVKCWCRGFKDGNFSLDAKFKSRRQRSDIGEAISQLLSKEPFFSARVLANRRAISLQTIKEILIHELGMRKFAQR
jgi:hypothetical protein